MLRIVLLNNHLYRAFEGTKNAKRIFRKVRLANFHRNSAASVASRSKTTTGFQAKMEGKKETRLSPNDPSSFARPDEFVVKHMHLNLEISFDRKMLQGKVDYNVERKKSAEQLILDVRDLTIKSVRSLPDNSSLKFDVSDMVKPFGSKLTVALPESPNTNVSLSIEYETSPQASGLQWLEASQTLDKKHPFLFSQFQAIHARSVLPCQDTPAVKSTYTASIKCPAPLTVLMSAKRIDNDKEPAQHNFEQNVPIPSYLIAIAAGLLESRELGPRSHVWAEPGCINSAEYEFAETETMLKAAEDICGPYVWGVYDLIVLPPSFPFGGMENPCLTFVTPTIIAGDRSLALVVAHEIAHSWTGNLVTNNNFEHFWLNEGFTVFLERKIAGRMKGENVQDFEALNGVNTLRETVKKLGETNPLTQLVLNLDNVHPDDSFSSIPYEKGHIFLRYLENLVGGPKVFEPFFKEYLHKFKYDSIKTEDFKNFFLSYFGSNAVVKNIEWETWLYKPGMPPYIPEYDRSLATVCEQLAAKWQKCSVEASSCAASENDMSALNSNQVNYFLQLLLESEPLPVEKLQAMDKTYKLSQVKNSEIRFRWIRLGLKARWPKIVDMALEMVAEVGRMKYIRPLYQDLYAWEEMRARAIRTFEENQKSMMYVSAYTVAKDLHVKCHSTNSC